LRTIGKKWRRVEQINVGDYVGRNFAFCDLFSRAVWLKYSYMPPQGPPGGVLLLVRSFNKFDKAGFAFTSPASKLHQFSDTPDAPERSPILLYEDGKPLGPAHSCTPMLRSMVAAGFHTGPVVSFFPAATIQTRI
jgi:hypothetical protein